MCLQHYCPAVDGKNVETLKLVLATGSLQYNVITKYEKYYLAYPQLYIQLDELVLPF
jgi:hypothetical protein